MKKQWIIPDQITSQASSELGKYSPVIRQMLFNRGYTNEESASRYIEAIPPDGTHPMDMLGVDQAVEVIQHAIRKQHKIAVYGDYDVDGVSSTALLTMVLESLGAQVRGYIPNRFDEGYGLNKDAIDNLSSDGTRLVITVDCGIRSPEEVEYAQGLGIEMIITDHHQPGDNLPGALAIINPKQLGDSYPDKNLAGVGLAYKLASGLQINIGKDKLEQKGIPLVEEYLDLVALGTVADVVPLTHENRSLVRRGLEYLQPPNRQGIMSLLSVSGLYSKRINAQHIGFILGPRLNAAGRLDSALAALELLRTKDVRHAAYLAQMLDDQNRERQVITRQVQDDAEKQALTDDPDALLLFASSPEFNPGVVGLAAGRLTEKFYRPSIVGHTGTETTRASCRSIPEFDITEALDQCEDLLEQHGGHAAAAGFTVRNNNLLELIERLKAISENLLRHKDLQPKLTADMEIELYDLKPSLLPELEWLQPTGHKNPGALFVSRNVKVSQSRTVGRDNSHLKMIVTDGRITYDAIAFNQGNWQENLPTYIDLLYEFELNEFNGRSTLQLNVRDIKPSGSSK